MRTWLITGCSRGLGRALAEAVLRSGDQLVATARDPEALADLVATGADRAIAVALDVTDEAAAARAVSAAMSRFGRPGHRRQQRRLWQYRPDRGHEPRRLSRSDRDQSVRHDHRDQGGDPSVPRTARRTVHSDLLDRRTLRRHGSRALFGGQVRGPKGSRRFWRERWRPSASMPRLSNPAVFRTDFAGSSTHIAEGNPPMPRPWAGSPRFSAPMTASSRAIRPGRRAPSSTCLRETIRRCVSCWAVTPMRARNTPKRPGSASSASGARRVLSTDFPPGSE